ncbi:hypothetical protein F5Y09DRAFT_300236 [Xylaria sp. FL1042]|nr:hypothetical protein F5Y09DRAFT_300236 [Xylaria sp. FL1042]
MSHTIRGNGLFAADAILAALANDPERLDRARNRFSKSPPPYGSQLSGTTTRTESPEPLGEEEQRRKDRIFQLTLEHKASWPRQQFVAQRCEEAGQVLIEKYKERGISSPISVELPVGDPVAIRAATARVKNRWVEQGIWNHRWKGPNEWQKDMPNGRWKHEFEPESESESDSEAGQSFFAQKKPKPPKSDEELRLAAERRATREREREASRPFHQFIYQLSRERERMQNELKAVEPPASVPRDINTEAYEKVRDIWIKRGIWDKKWGSMPGMSWKHERPLDQLILEELGPAPVPPQANPPGDHGRRVYSQVFGPPPKEHEQPLNESLAEELGPDPGPSQTKPLEDDGHGVPGQTSGDLSTGIDMNKAVCFKTISDIPNEYRHWFGLPELPNGNTDQSPTTPHSQRSLTESAQSYHSVPRQRRSRDERVSPPRDGRSRLTGNTGLGPVHPARVSKTPPKRKRPGHGRGRVASELSSDTQPPLPELGLLESPPVSAPVSAPVQPRRSKRLQEVKLKASLESTTTLSNVPVKSIPPPKSKQRSAGKPKSSDSAKPKGVSKRQRPNTRRLKSK